MRWINWLLRLVGLIIFGAVGWNMGETLQNEVLRSVPTQIRDQLPLILAVPIGLIGVVVMPDLIIRPLTWIQREIKRVPIQSLIVATIGLAIGLLISVPIAYALQLLKPHPLGYLLPTVAAAVLGYLGMMAGLLRQKDLFALLGGRLSKSTGFAQKSDYVLLDTSVIIDGRIADVSQTGFIEGTMLVPRFVLNELQHIADSPDTLRRNRGRRGLDILNKLQKHSKLPIEVTDMDTDDVQEVDTKLVHLARKLKCPIITNDYNLNRVAALQDVKVLNINELANAVKTLILPGETLRVRIIQEGKELGQGVGYLDDGTMVVVENGRRYMNSTMDVTVTRVLQTEKGRMMFATPNGGSKG